MKHKGSPENPDSFFSTKTEGVTKAVALRYDEESAPKVSAKGEHEIADEIIALATAHGVPLYENASLVELLGQLELGDEIPEILYRSIAEIIAFAYYLQGKVPKNFQQEE